jgi:hypothetical protein
MSLRPTKLFLDPIEDSQAEALADEQEITAGNKKIKPGGSAP